MKQYYLKYKNSNICIYEKGNGKIPIVLIHGAGLDSAMLSWYEVIHLFPSDYTVYAIDLLGHGKSDRHDDLQGDSFYKFHNDCLEHIIVKLNLNGFVLSGLSMGGAIAIGYTLSNPNKVKALIPVNSWGLSSKMPFQKFLYWYVNTTITRKIFGYFLKFRWLTKACLRYLLIGDKTKINDTLIDEIHSTILQSDVGKSMEQFQVSSIHEHHYLPDLTNQLSNINIPVLFISGEKDTLVRVKDVIIASKVLQKSELHIMKQCKHWAQKERPEEYVEVINRFMSRRNLL